MFDLDIKTFLFLVLALLSGFYMAWNIGANDVANAIGTSVGSGALKLRRAVILAAIFEFCGSYFFGGDVSETMSHGIIRIDLFQHEPMRLALGMIGSLLATGIWLQLASYFGWPVSTTHSIVGAIAGFGLYSYGIESLLHERLSQIALSWLISPLVGGILSFGAFTCLRRTVFFKPRPWIAVIGAAPTILSTFCTVMGALLLLNITSKTQLRVIGIEIGMILTSFTTLTYVLTQAVMEWRGQEEIISEEKNMQTELATHKIESAIASLIQVREQMPLSMQPQLNERIKELSSMLGQIPLSSCALKNPQMQKVEGFFAKMQCVSACFMALSHGANDVSNAVGPLAVAISILYENVVPIAAPTPGWILALGGFGIVVGLATWGWRVIETVGKKITQLTPSRGVSAEFGCASTVLVCSQLGLPVSTTHVLVGSILGVGLARGIGALNLSTLRDIVLSWLITLPMGALLSIGMCIFMERVFAYL